MLILQSNENRLVSIMMRQLSLLHLDNALWQMEPMLKLGSPRVNL
jgi:hypothetical protein